MGRFPGLLAGCCLLSACATTSFAPPSVNLENEMAVRGSNRFLQGCKPNERLKRTTENGKPVDVPIPITEDAKGAQRLIDNFVYMYRCSAHSAANGRQGFEVPALITGVGTAAAAAFGAGPNVAIAGGTATALLSGGKSYYAPQQKADIYDSALDALLCIKAEAAGVDPITVEKIGVIEGVKAVATQQDEAGVPITTSEQYFHLIATSLLSVERVLAQRLSVVGTFDPAGVIAEIKTLAKEVEEKKDAAEVSAAAEAGALVSTDANTPAAIKAKVVKLIPPATVTAEVAKIENTIIGLAVLQPKLQQCVVRAKI